MPNQPNDPQHTLLQIPEGFSKDFEQATGKKLDTHSDSSGVKKSFVGFSQNTTEESHVRLNANYKYVACIFTNHAYGWEEELVLQEDYVAEKMTYVVHDVVPDEKLTQGCKFAIFIFIIDDKNTRRRVEKKFRKKKYNLEWNVYEYEPIAE